MMKKMMMILAALSAVTLAHAAAIDWQSGSFLKPGTTEKVGKEQVWGYMFLIDKATYDNLTNPDAVYYVNPTAADKDKVSRFSKTSDGATFTLWDGTTVSLADTKSSNPKASGGTTGTSNFKTGYNDENAHTGGKWYYAAVVYEFFDEAVKADKVGTTSASQWIANTAALEAPDVGNGTVANLGINWHGGSGTPYEGSTTAALGWQAVPEPMCAALLALGAAVLGLRRKRS